MAVPDKNEIELAYEVLIGVQRIMKGPGKRYWTMGYYRFDEETKQHYKTHKICVGGDRYWSPAYMYYDPHGPALVIYGVFEGKDNELLRIDLTNPQSLTRRNLRECFKKAVERYAEGCRKAVERHTLSS